MHPALEPLERRVLLGGDPLATPHIIDDSDAGFAAAGAWAEITTGGFDGDHLQAAGEPANLAAWTFEGLTPGYRYRVSATWSPYGGGPAEARYAILNHVNDDVCRTLGTVSLDQTSAPDDLIDAGAAWEDLGGPYLVRGNTLCVQVSGAAGGTILADAVRIERVGGWLPPTGVPAPQFGIEQTHWTYSQEQYEYDYGSGPQPYRLGGSGPYTHYVDNTHPQASDSNNPLGTPAQPRMTVPEDVPAGSVVEIHGGPYAYAGELAFWGAGTPALPVFLRGPDRESAPIFQGVTAGIHGQYIIVENLVFDGGRIGLEHRPDHVSMRRLEVRNYDPWGFGTALGSTGTDVVIYDVHVHHNGDYTSYEEDDVHGTKPRGQRIWVLDSHMHHNGGDSVQVKGGGDIAGDAQYIYIARNVLHEDRENAVDIKASRHVIVSENIMYGYAPTAGSGSDGTAIVAAHEGAELGWFLFNEISDSYRGIRVNDALGHPVAYLIGNTLHDIGDIAVYTYYSSSLHMVNNVIYDADTGFDGRNSDSDYHLTNNIIANARTHIEVEHGQHSESHHNLLYRQAGQVHIEWDGQDYYSVPDFQAIGQGQGSLEADPLFVSVSGNDFRLRDGPAAVSPAIDAGASIQQYVDLFELSYGLDIAVGSNGVARPQGAGVDMGPFEADGSLIPVNNPPAAADLAVTTDEDTPVIDTVTATDADGDPLAYSLFQGPAHGVAELADDGAFTYTPDANWHGTDSFGFRAFDGWEHSPPATATITVVNLKAPGDANGDGLVDVMDLVILCNNWGRSQRQWWDGDFNEDGVVDILDLTILSNNLGSG